MTVVMSSSTSKQSRYFMDQTLDASCCQTTHVKIHASLHNQSRCFMDQTLMHLVVNNACQTMQVYATSLSVSLIQTCACQTMQVYATSTVFHGSQLHASCNACQTTQVYATSLGVSWIQMKTEWGAFNRAHTDRVVVITMAPRKSQHLHVLMLPPHPKNCV